MKAYKWLAPRHSNFRSRVLFTLFKFFFSKAIAATANLRCCLAKKQKNVRTKLRNPCVHAQCVF